MEWAAADIAALLVVGQTLEVNLGLVMNRRMALGQSIDSDMNLLEFAQNLTWALEYGTEIYEDEDYDYVNGQISMINNICSKYIYL